MYGKAVYPLSQWGATSLAILAGATLQNLTESQYGMASLNFRWNVSGTYQQVIPRYISVKPGLDPTDPQTECVEFLREYFPSNSKLFRAIFLKGYQWPFNAERIQNSGSSLIDFAVHIETVVRKRRVYLDFRQNPIEFNWDVLEKDARSYLENSGGVQDLPIERLHHMNSKAIDLYQSHGINLWEEPLEIGVCAQHCNGGVTGDIWWQTSIPRLFAIGEVNGTHGIHRPGGSALNSGQVGAIRVAEKIAYGQWNAISDTQTIVKHLEEERRALISTFTKRISPTPELDPYLPNFLRKLQTRMMQIGAYLRDISKITPVLEEIRREITEFFAHVTIQSGKHLLSMWKTYDALITQFTFLTAYQNYLENGGGSRGSFVVISEDESDEMFIPHPKLAHYRIKKNKSELNGQIQEIRLTDSNPNDWSFVIKWVDRRPLPVSQGWFETVWKNFDEKSIFL
jgi:succinate dehydrogenase/fumarate reductase flavoprotein subunit